MSLAQSDPSLELLPERFRRWFAERGWTPRAHQLALLQRAQAGRAALLIAPTGAGKTLAGFLPTLVELSGAGPRVAAKPSPLVGEGGSNARSGFEPGEGMDERGDHALTRPRSARAPSPTRGEGLVGGMHTLYISPLKALAVDIA
ncbi:MAG: DEAD/DEAH box helicase, partial [Rhodopseudomonas palustris]|nr:DEAD/DEAH box helicase [Rhodopseudomonas palustris]